ncbi:MAG: type II secretion system F family protein [Clostridia bacterium]|nr:type II secretion system F family protein [Clostridia bacterium]
MLNVIAAFTFLSVFFLVYPLLKHYCGKKSSISRLESYINTEHARTESKKAERREFKAGLGIISRSIGSVRFLDSYKKRIQLQLGKAHVLLKAEEFITIALACAVLFMLMGFVLFKNASFALLFVLLGYLTPFFVLKSKIKAREKHLNDQLGDAISLISNSLKAGYSFFQAVDTVAKEMSGPIAQEFSIMQKEINLGLPTEKALENLVGRVLSDNLELVVTAVLIQRQVGGNLAEVLDNISSTIRDRIKIKGDIKTVTAQGRMSAIIIAILPVILGVVLFMINPEHIGVLFKDPIGIAILVFSVLMELIGIYFISKVVQIDI